MASTGNTIKHELFIYDKLAIVLNNKEDPRIAKVFKPWKSSKKQKEEYNPNLTYKVYQENGRYTGQRIEIGNVEYNVYETMVKYHRPHGKTGRLCANQAIGSQMFSRQIRHLIQGDIYNDIDIVNCHYVLLSQYCQKKGYEAKYINRYIQKRDKIFKRLDAGVVLTEEEKKGNEEIEKRDKLKTLFTKIMYGSRPKISDFIDTTKISSRSFRIVESLIKEMSIVHNKMIEDEENKETLKSIKNKHEGDKTYNIGGKLCSRVMQEIEDKILMKCEKFLRTYTAPGITEYVMNYAIKHMVYCFDGFQIPKYFYCSNSRIKIDVNDEFLIKLANYVDDKLKYRVEFKVKPMNQPADISGLVNSNEITVETDDDICRELMNKIDLVRCGNASYVKYGGVWTRNPVFLSKSVMELTRHYRIHTSKKKDVLMYQKNLNTVLERLSNMIDYKDNFLADVQKKIVGTLFFKNGVYDFNEKRLREERKTDESLYRISFDFPEKVDEDAKKFIIQLLNMNYDKGTYGDDKFLMPKAKNLIQHIARGIAGMYNDKRSCSIEGLRNSGKTLLIELCKLAFERNTDTIGSKELFIKKNDTRDEMAIMGSFLGVIASRVLFIDEMDEDGVMSSKTMKSIQGAGLVKARDNYKSKEFTIDFIPAFRVFFCCNKMAKFDKGDTNEYISPFFCNKKYESKTAYDKVDKSQRENTYIYVADPDLKNKINTDKCRDAFISIVLENYIDEPVVDVDEVQEIADQIMEDTGDDLTKTIKTRFDFSDPSARVPKNAAMDEIRKFNKNVSLATLRQRLGIMNVEFKRNVMYGDVGDKIKTDCFIGIKLKYKNDDGCLDDS